MFVFNGEFSLASVDFQCLKIKRVEAKRLLFDEAHIFIFRT